MWAPSETASGRKHYRMYYRSYKSLDFEEAAKVALSTLGRQDEVSTLTLNVESAT
jgi:hypothetical protein